MIIAKYTASASGVLPTFNNGYIYEVTEIAKDGIYEVDITSEDAPTTISFSGKNELLTVEYLNIEKVTTMLDMFVNCKQLTSLDLSGWDTSAVTNMRAVFYNCSGLTSLDLSGWDTSKVTSMYDMFNGCKQLTSLNLSGWDTGKVTDMTAMFRGCSALTSLDLSGWDTGKVTNMYAMFYSCNQLTSLDVSGWDTSQVTNMQYTFNSCSALTSLDLSGWDTGEVTSMQNMFNNCRALTSLDLSGWDTSKVTDMYQTFNECIALTALDVSGWDTGKVTNMQGTFRYCYTLTSLDVSGFNTSKVTNMQYTFSDCSALTSLDISGWDTSQVTDMVYMFYGCSALTSLDLSGFKTSKVTDMGYMFNNCSALTSLDLSSWDTSAVTSIYDIFAGCSALTSLDLSGWDTSAVTNMRGAFYNCKQLTSLDLSNWVMNGVDNSSFMFTSTPTSMHIGMLYCSNETVIKIAQQLTSCTIWVKSTKASEYDISSVTFKDYTAVSKDITLSKPLENADRLYWDGELKKYLIEHSDGSIDETNITNQFSIKAHEDITTVACSGDIKINVPFKVVDEDYVYDISHELDYIKQSFELRFPDEDDVPEGWGFLGIQDEEGTGLKALIDWIDTSSDEEFLRDFDQHFNRDYTQRYFLLVITLGMVDNLGKNMMLDTWDNKIFMPRFYDCDTICSYDNSGQLKFDVDIEMTQGYWNTSSSRLWTRMRDLMHDELVAKYNNMRQNGLSYESLMHYFYDEQIAKIPQKYYNMDYDIKYAPFADSYMGMANGDVYEHLKRWLTQRLRFVDTLYDYAPSYNNDVLTIRANTTEPMTLYIETYTPVYQHLSWYNNQMDKKKIDGKTRVEFTGRAMAATDQEVLIYGGSNIKRILGISSMNPNRMLIGSATKLIELDASNSPLLADINANKANLSPHTYLNKLNLSNCPLLGGNLRLNASPLIREIDISGTAITGLNLPSNIRNLESMKLPNGIPSLMLNDASMLHTLEFDEGVSLSSVNMINCNKLVNTTNFDLTSVQSVLLDNSMNNYAELYFRDTSNLTLKNMPNLEKVIYEPNAEYEIFDKANIDNASVYTITTFNNPNLKTFMTTAPYRDSYNKKYPEIIEPDKLFIANKVDLSNTQFTDIRLLCTTDTNEMIIPKTVKRLVVDSAYDLDTQYLTDGDYETIHKDLAECYETDYIDEVYVSRGIQTNHIEFTAYEDELKIKTDFIRVKPGTQLIYNQQGLVYLSFSFYGYDRNKENGYELAFGNGSVVGTLDFVVDVPNDVNYIQIIYGTRGYPNDSFYTQYPDRSILTYEKLEHPNIIPTASDGSLIYSIHTKYKENIDNVWDLEGLKMEEYHVFGMNNDIKYEDDKLTMPNRTDEYDIDVEGLELQNEVAVYMSSDPDYRPTFNDGFEYKTLITDCNDNGEYEIHLYSDDKPTSISFSNSTAITYVGYLQLEKVTNLWDTFNNCKQLTSLDVRGWDTSQVTSMLATFYNCTQLTSLDLSGWDTSAVTTMHDMFYGCKQLTSLDLSGFNTGKVTTMQGMFSGCSSLTSLDLSGWDTSALSTMYCMFQNCSALTSLDVSGWDTSAVDNMQNMFTNCKQLTSLDLSGWDTSKVTTMWDTFSGCNQLTSLDVSGWDTSKVATMYGMFNNCKQLTSLDVSTWNTSAVTNMYGTFANCSALTSLDLSGWDTSKVTSMQGMFQNCSALTSLDLSGFDTSAVTSMQYTFNGCSGLTSLDLSGWDTRAVTNMQDTFSDCKQLTSLDVSGWDTSAVTNMSYMFRNCSALTSLDLSGWVTSQVTTMQGTFQNCSGLTSLDVSGFNTSKVTNMYTMFSNCKQLTSLDVSGWDTSAVTNMGGMFDNCKQLTSLDVSGFDTSAVTNMQSMFNGCSALTSLDLSGWDTSSVVTMHYTFNGCNQLTSLDLSGWDTIKVTGMMAMFGSCTQLTSLNAPIFYISVNLSVSPLNLDSALDIINKLASVQTSQTLDLSNTTIALLSDEHVIIAVNKGWTVV